MTTRSKNRGPGRVEELDVVGLSRFGAPAEDLPGIMAASLVLEACDEGRIEAAFPGDQAEAVSVEAARIIEEGGGAGRVAVRPHRLGWRVVSIEIGMCRSCPLTD